MDEAIMSELTSSSTLAPDCDLADSDLPEFGGLPGDRQARLAARRAFVDMKQLFMRAVEDLSDRKGQWLRDKVRLATDPMDLWLLRSPVLGALQRDDAAARQLRAQLYRGLDHIFPMAFGLNTGMPSTLPAPWELPAADREPDAIWR